MFDVLFCYLIFGLFENIIIFMFLKYVYGVKAKYIDILYLSPLFIFASIFNIPFGKQLFGIIIMILYIIIRYNIKILKSIKYITVAFMYLLCVEMVVCAPIDILLNIDLTKMGYFDKFIWLIPIRIIEISLIFIYKKYKK